MRINGFEQIKAFYSWVFNNPDKVRPTHISLYLFLWNQGNRANWVEWFKCPYDLAMQGACIGNKGTYYKCLDELQSFKLIEYKKGLNNYKAPQIKLVKLYKSEPLSEQVTVPLSEPQTVPLTELLPVHIYKLITNNKKLVIENIERWIESETKGKEFTPEQFLKWFNETRTKYLEIPSNCNMLTYKDKINLTELTKHFNGKQFNVALLNLCNDQWANENNMVIPKHFLDLDNFNKYVNIPTREPLTREQKKRQNWGI